jgi:hypothetical protein
MYLFVRRLLSRPAGLIAALVYVYLPYHLFDLYVRAALAESVGFVFVPLTLWGFYETVTRPRLHALLGAALAYAGLMFTSNLLALLFTPILGLYVAVMIIWQFLIPAKASTPVISRATSASVAPAKASTPAVSPMPVTNLAAFASGWTRQWNSVISNRYGTAVLSGFPSLLALGLGLGLSAIFWLPAILEYHYVRVDQWVGGRFAFGDDFVEIFQLFSPTWGFGASIPGPDDEAGFQIGLAATVLFILSFLVTPKLQQPLVRRTLYFFQAMTLLLLFLTTPASTLLWTLLPLSTFAQFPWRLLVIVAPLISIVAGAIIAAETFQPANLAPPTTTPPHPPISLSPPGRAVSDHLSTIILAGLILLSSYPYIRAEVRDPKPTEGPVSQAALFRFQQSSDEMTGQTAWVQRIPNWSSLAEQVERGGEIKTKVNYTALPTDNSVGVFSMEMSSIHELLWVGTEKEGQAVTFLIPYYPGWMAYIYEDLGPHDGNLDKNVGPVTRIGPVVDRPQIRTTPIEGWMVVPIPPGSHFLELRFEDTPVRVVGQWVSIISALLWVGLFLLKKIGLSGKVS